MTKSDRTPLVFAVDYDGTMTADIQSFLKILNILLLAEHTVYIVTMRYDNDKERIDPRWIPEGVTVHYTGRQAKQPYMEGLDIKVNIWMDDNPHWILVDSK